MGGMVILSQPEAMVTASCNKGRVEATSTLSCNKRRVEATDGLPFFLPEVIWGDYCHTPSTNPEGEGGGDGHALPSCL